MKGKRIVKATYFVQSLSGGVIYGVTHSLKDAVGLAKAASKDSRRDVEILSRVVIIGHKKLRKVMR